MTIEFQKKEEGSLSKSKKSGNSPSKYIATAVEALLAAMYLDNDKNIELILEVAKHWRKLIDKQPNI